jgi:formiminotetrahydrofolate cyclodeaminase
MSKINKLDRDLGPSKSERDREMLRNIEDKYNIVLKSDETYIARKEKLNENKKITIPKPFKFLDRKKDTNTISETRFNNFLNEREKEMKQ